MRRFTFCDPDTGETLAAEITTQKAHNARATRKYPDGTHVSSFTYILGVTQWGFDRQTTWVVCRCDNDGKTWAYKLTEFWQPDECIWAEHFSEPRSGLTDKEQVGQAKSKMQTKASKTK